MSSLTMRVEVLVGTDIRQAVQDARDLALKLNLTYIVFNFNGVSVNVQHTSDIDDLVDKYHISLHNDTNFII